MKNRGFADVLIGLQYGDEGKAKVIDLIAKNYHIIARFNGGANAGHTIETDKTRVALHQIPSGIFYKDKLLYVGSGCVVDVSKMITEIDMIEKLNIPLKNRLFISDQTSVVQPHHVLVDIYTAGKIGTTKNGIGPAYADKAMRMVNGRHVNIKLGELIDNPELFDHIKENLERKIKKHDAKDYDVEKIMANLKKDLKRLMPYIQRDTLFLQKQVYDGKNVLFEGAQSIMLDVTKGLVPFVTSSSTVAAAAFVGGDLPANYHRKTIGVAKAIMSRVGNGPFVSEFGGEKSEEYCKNPANNKDFEKQKYDVEKLLSSEKPFDVGIALRILGNEYGTVTKRPRRIGMLDLVQLAFAVKTNGVDEIFLTKCDLLVDFAKTKSKKIPVVTEYSLNGKTIDYVPGSNTLYAKVKVKEEYLPSFTET
ncbi:MAG: adenylosuccinate synthetase, partial [Patescibacteria group bacterium]|nr:adenylosuccinate synthetase [Patescibacteria group bacterium]